MDKLLIVLKKHRESKDAIASSSTPNFPDGGIFIVNQNKNIESSISFTAKEDIEGTSLIAPVGLGSHTAGYATVRPSSFIGLSAKKSFMFRFDWSKTVGGVIKSGGRFAMPTSMTAVTSSKDGALLVCGDGSGRVFCWDSVTGELVREFQAHTGPIAVVMFSDDQGTIYTAGGEDGTVKCYLTADVFGRAGKGGGCPIVDASKSIRLSEGSRCISKLIVLPGYNNASHGCATIGGATIAVLDADNLFIVYVPSDKSNTGSKNDRVRISLPSKATSMAVSPDGSNIAVGCTNGCIYIYQVASVMTDPKHAPIESLPKSEGAVQALVYSYEGTALTSASDDGVKMWDLTTTPSIAKHHLDNFAGRDRILAIYGFIEEAHTTIEDVETDTNGLEHSGPVQTIHQPSEGLQRTIHSTSSVPRTPTHFARSVKTTNAKLFETLSKSRSSLVCEGKLQRVEKCLLD